MTMDLLTDARALGPELAAFRRELHADPEVGLELPRTQRRVLAALDGLPLEVTTGDRLSSVTAVLRGARPGPTVLLRGDMDALPVREETGLDYASSNGAMHACGHDLHTAALVGAAQLLSARQEELAGDIVFMFQPGEEGWDGAGLMISEGVLAASGRTPVAAYALHVSTEHSVGTFHSRTGTLMAGSATVEAVVRGAGGHGALPHRAKDPVPVVAELVTALQALVTRKFDVFDPLVLSVGRLRAGEALNVIPAEAELGATVRAFSPEVLLRAEDEIVRLIRHVTEAHGLDVSVDFAQQYPPTITDGAETAFAAETVRKLFGDESWYDTRPLPGSEDFSRVLAEVPGGFVFVGAQDAQLADGAVAPNHSPLAVFDDTVVADCGALLADLALGRLKAAATTAEQG